MNFKVIVLTIFFLSGSFLIKMEHVDSKAKLDTLLDSVDTFLFDMDGVLWHGLELLPYVRESLKLLRDLGKRIYFVTNNSTKSRRLYAEKISRFGIPCHVDDIIGSAYAAAYFLKKNLPSNDSKAFLIAHEKGGLQEELALEGVKFIANLESDSLPFNPEQENNWEVDPTVGAVVVGFDGHLTFRKLAHAQMYLCGEKRMMFLATNTDPTYPLGKKLLPGTGAIVQAVATAAGRQPTVCGKPSQTMLECAFEKFNLNPTRTCMVGDNIHTDIQFGKAGGMKTLAVLTGVATKELLDSSDDKPDYYVKSLGTFHELSKV